MLSPISRFEIVYSIFWEDPLEKEMATQSNILAWEIPWTEEPGGLQSTESRKNQTGLRNWTTYVCACRVPSVMLASLQPHGW